MSFKFPSIASFFSRVSHKVEDEKKSSASQFVKITSHKTDSKESSSKISRFFHRLFQSKEKAREGVEAVVKTKNVRHPVSLPVQSQSNECASLSVDVISFNTAAQKYLEKLNEITTAPANPADSKTKLDQNYSNTSDRELHKSNRKDDRNVSNEHEARYAELDQNRSFIESNEGLFMIDIANMGSIIDKPEQYFRCVHGLDLQKTLTAAFQIYYEEGKRVHEDSFATPGWGHEATAESSEDLQSLKANLEKIQAQRPDGHKLLEKAVGAVEGRIISLNEERQKTSNPS
jgi:hypothetical protein